MGPGFAAKGGIISALMAEKGITGAKNVLEGDIGMFPLYHQGSYDIQTLTADLGKHFEGINVSIKPYPCCRGVHPSIDAGLALVNKHNIKPEDVREVTIFVGEGHHYRLCRPFEAKCNPRNVVDAQFSIPWGVATAISRRRATMEDFTETAIKSRDILDVTSKIKVEVDTGLNSPHKMEPVRVQIVTKDGRVYSERMDDPLGSPQKPMSFSDCEKKFRNCSSHSVKKLPDERIDKIIELVGRLEQVKDVRELIELLH
jgi:2-methylcitrate dehydratase PrpD